MEEFDTSSAGAHANCPRASSRARGRVPAAHENNCGGRVGDADCHLLEARDLLEYSLPVMNAVAADASALECLRI
jgi:hypothetical protein